MARVDLDQEQLNYATGDFRVLQDKHAEAERALHEALHRWCVGTQELQLAGMDAGQESQLQASIGDLCRAFLSGIRGRLAEIRSRADDLITTQGSLQKAMADHPIPVAAWIEAASAARNDLQRLSERICRWSGSTTRSA
jgi:hypothetical protein